MPAQFTTEMFCHFFYSPKLSYQELLEREAELKSFVSGLVEEGEGAYLHFEGMGDALRAQCVYASYIEDSFHDFCDKLAPEMDDTVEARILFVNKDLENLHIYLVSNKKWQEVEIFIPTGPLQTSPVE